VPLEAKFLIAVYSITMQPGEMENGKIFSLD
jgi:hypothetical protein